MSGSSSQPAINGVYDKSSNTTDGHPYYTKGAGSQTRVMYWISDHGGKWIIADEIGKHLRAIEPDGATPTFGPAVLNGWLTWKKKWQVESSVMVRQSGVHPGPHVTMSSCRHVIMSTCHHVVLLSIDPTSPVTLSVFKTGITGGPLITASHR